VYRKWTRDGKIAVLAIPHRESLFADAAISLHQFNTPSFANDINNHVMLSTPTAPHQVDFGSSSAAASFGGGTCGGV